MKPEAPCYGCDNRTPSCHGSCQAYADFRKATIDHKNSTYPKLYGEYERYVKQHKSEAMDEAAKKGWRRSVYQKKRYR